MYITDTTENVRKLFDKLDNKEDKSKMKILLYLFDLLNNNQINNKNEINPNLVEDDDLIIFNLESIGFESNVCTIFLQFNIMLYYRMTNTNELYEENGSVMGLVFDSDEKLIISQFEKLNFEEKLDVFSELITRYNNETYFKDWMNIAVLGSENSDFDIAKLILEFKKTL